VDVAVGLVDQVEVQVIELQTPKRGVDGVPRALEAGVLHPKLGRDEELIARHPASGDAAPDGFLVEVRRRGVDEAVADLDGVNDAALAFLRVRDLKDAIAGNGHLDAVAERDGLHDRSQGLTFSSHSTLLPSRASAMAK